MKSYKASINLFLFFSFFAFIFGNIIVYNENENEIDDTILTNSSGPYLIKHTRFAPNESIILEEEYSQEKHFDSNVTKEIEDKVVNGSPASIRRFSYQVSVTTSTNLCGGSLIRWRWVLTAQHCVEGFKATDFIIRAGSRKFYDGGVLATVDLVVKHGGYSKPFNDIAYNDIAMLRMPRGFRKFRKRFPIKPIKLIANVPADGAKVIATGYGTLSTGGSLPRYLQKAILLIINFSTCDSNYGGFLTTKMVCAGYLSGAKGVCNGDSGGPLMYKRRLLGIVSFGNGCATPNFPGVFVSVPSYKNWIKKVLKKF